MNRPRVVIIGGGFAGLEAAQIVGLSELRREAIEKKLDALIDGLRMVRGNTKDLVLPPPDSDEFIFLARRVGYQTEDWQAGAKHLLSDIEQHMKQNREFFEQMFGKV